MSQHADFAQAPGFRPRGDAHALNAQASPAAKADHAAQKRRTRTLQRLNEARNQRYAIVGDPEATEEAVIVAMAIRMAQGKAVTHELRIPRDKYDPFVFVEALERDARHCLLSIQ